MFSKEPAMAYLKHFEYDLFISYADEDNATGWIDDLRKVLELLIDENLGSGGKLKIRFDKPKLVPNEPFVDTTVAECRNSALFLCMVSPNYLNSESCRKELAAFLQRGDDAGSGDNPRTSLLYKVLVEEVCREEQPKPLENVIAFRLFKDSPLNKDWFKRFLLRDHFDLEQQFVLDAASLASNISDALRKLARSPVDEALPNRVMDSKPPARAKIGSADAAPAPYYDDNVQFTVYRPRTMRPLKWYPLLAFAHLDERPSDAAEDEPDPLEEVKRQAEQILGDRAKDFRQSTADSSHAIPREGAITFLPEMNGVEFNPPRVTFRWIESVHKTEFRLRASAALEGQAARGRISVFLGGILLADIALSIRVSNEVAGQDDKARTVASARPYRKIFASYSHRDMAIVEQFESYGRTLGDKYLRDWTTLRSGELWNDQLRQLIDEADVFQLFWSRNAMRSGFVRQEWEHALALNRPHFIRPVYWEEPLPEDGDLPPASLRRIHFQRLAFLEASDCLSLPNLAASSAEGHKVEAPSVPPVAEWRGAGHSRSATPPPISSRPEPTAKRGWLRRLPLVGVAALAMLFILNRATVDELRKGSPRPTDRPPITISVPTDTHYPEPLSYHPSVYRNVIEFFSALAPYLAVVVGAGFVALLAVIGWRFLKRSSS